MTHRDPAQEHILGRAGSNIHSWISGPENGPLVVFTHGATLDHHMFDAQIEPLNAAGYRVLTWDMRGHGQSKPMGADFSLQMATEDLVAVLDQVAIESAVFIGHSFGGFVTQEMMSHHPERVTALGVIGCTDMAKQSATALIQVASKVLPHLLPLFSLQSFRKRTVEHVSLKDEVTRYAYEATGRLSKEEFITVIMAGVAGLSSDARGRASVIARPFLLTHGEQDKANNGIYPRSAPEWARKEPHCTYKVVPQAGHTANQDNPEAFNAILLRFLQEQVSTSP